MCEMRAGNGVDGTAFTAIAAVGAAARDELLAPETHASGAAGSRLNEDVDFVDEHSESGICNLRTTI